MFNNCSSLVSVEFNTTTENDHNLASITYMDNMFKSCKKLNSINFGKLNLSMVSNINSLFEDCSSLSNINLNYFDTSNIEFYDNLFKGINSEGTISYNSSILDEKILKDLPPTWEKIDINKKIINLFKHY